MQPKTVQPVPYAVYHADALGDGLLWHNKIDLK